MSVLSDKIKNELIKLSKSDKHLQSIIKKLESGNATFADVDAFTQATGAVLKKAFEKSIVESPKSFVEEEMLTEILGDIFGDNYELINSVAENVQKQLDKAAGIGIKPQRADFPSERIENLAKITAQKDLADKAALSEFTASVENINGSIFTDYIRANADFRSKAGFQVYVIRTDHGGCCEWCAKLAGKYVYPNVPKDVWRRHKRCSCEIIYVNERAGTYDRISFNDKADGSKITTTKQVMRLTPEQAKAKEKEVLSRIDKSAKSGIIINEQSKKPITKITDKAIENVPKVKIDGYTDEQCDLIQQNHKELLKYSRDNNDCKEIAFVMDNSMGSRKVFSGSDDKLDFGNELYGKDLFVMHNHPRNSSFSDTDIAFILGSDNIRSLSIVKNSGSVEVLTKTAAFNKEKAINEFRRSYKKYVKIGNDLEVDKAVEKFIIKYKEGMSWITSK